jgi:hypothetical protein
MDQEMLPWRSFAEADLVTPTPIVSLHDVIANQPLTFTGHTAKLKIPAGAFRIVDLKQVTPWTHAS